MIKAYINTRRAAVWRRATAIKIANLFLYFKKIMMKNSRVSGKGGKVMTGGLGAVFWLIVSLGLFIIEGATVQFICLWFAAGSLLAGIAAYMGAPFLLQLLIFLVSSVAALIIGRPLLLKRFSPRQQATNADRVIGQLGMVLEEVDNLKQTGRVSANGLEWTARSEYDEIIPANTTVVILRIDGVKLIVQKIKQEAVH